MIRRPPRSTQSRSSAASDVYKRQLKGLWASAPMGASIEPVAVIASRPMANAATMAMVLLLSPLNIFILLVIRKVWSYSLLTAVPLSVGIVERTLRECKESVKEVALCCAERVAIPSGDHRWG